MTDLQYSPDIHDHGASISTNSCLLCGFGGPNCSQIRADNREKWSQNWCCLFSIEKEEVKSMIRDAFYCVECQEELGRIGILLTEMGKLNSRIEVIKLTNFCKLKDSIQSVQLDVENGNEEIQKRLMLFECIQNINNSAPAPASSLNGSVENKNEIKFVDRNLANSMLDNNRCDILNHQFNLTKCVISLPRAPPSNPASNSQANSVSPNASIIADGISATVQTLNTTTTRLNPFLHAYHAEINSVSVPKDDDGIILQRLNNLKELTIEVKSLNIPFAVQNINKLSETASIQLKEQGREQPEEQKRRETFGNSDFWQNTKQESSRSQIFVTLKAQEMESLADCDTVELPEASYWNETNLTGQASSRSLVRCKSLSPPFVDFVDTEEESCAGSHVNHRKIQGEINKFTGREQQEERLGLPCLGLKRVLREEDKMHEKIHLLPQTVVASSTNSFAPQLRISVAGKSENNSHAVSKKETPSSSNPSACSFSTSLNSKFEQRARIENFLFKCHLSECGRLFESELKRDAHIQRLHEGVKFPYTCKACNCGHAFANFNDLEEHEASHNGLPALVCSESGCSMEFYTGVKLTQHRLQVHHQQQHQQMRYHCKPCGKLIRTTRTNRGQIRRHSVKCQLPLSVPVKSRAQRFRYKYRNYNEIKQSVPPSALELRNSTAKIRQSREVQLPSRGK